MQLITNSLFGRLSVFLLATVAFSACADATKTSPAPVDPPEPTNYAPVTFANDKYELLGSVSVGTPITLINHVTGEVFFTSLARTARKRDYMGDVQQYGTPGGQPKWATPENTFRQIRATTAIVGGHVENLLPIPKTLLDNKSLAAKIDKRIRSESLLDSVLTSMGEKESLIANDREYLSDKLPVLYEIRDGDRWLTLVSYAYSFPGNEEEQAGPKFLMENDKLYPLLGNCASLPHFYALDGHVYFRHMTAQCESGYIVVGNYVVLADRVKKEWLTYAYAN